MACRWVFLVVALCVTLTEAARPSDQKSVSLTRDGHFQLAADASEMLASQPAPAQKEQRLIQALLPLHLLEPEPRSLPGLQVSHPSVVAVHEGSWFRNPSQKAWAPAAASAFKNRTDNWMTLSKAAAGSLLAKRDLMSKRSQNALGTPAPTVPPTRYTKKPESWPLRTWSFFSKAAEKLKPLTDRSGVGNIVATGFAVFLGPESCILKILYVFFSMAGEDDYPYIPRGCGDMFDFAMDANGIRVPWMLIVGALFIVTSNSAANTVH